MSSMAVFRPCHYSAFVSLLLHLGLGFHCNFSLRAVNTNQSAQALEVLIRAAHDGNWTTADEGITD